MNINIKLPNELQEKIEAVANERLTDLIDDVLQNDEEITELIKKTIQGQIKTVALEMLQSQTMRTKMCQKVYPIIYKTFGIEVKDEKTR